MTLKRVCWSVFGILFFSYIYAYGGGGWNQNARLDTLHAIVEHGTLSIDAFHQNTGDKALHDGRYYSSKPPGTVFLGLPAFFLSYTLLDVLGVALSSPKGWLVSAWMTTAGTIGLLAGAGGVAIFLVLRSLVSEKEAFIVTMFLFLGTPVLPYATVFFSHSGTVGLLALALALALLHGARPRPAYSILCGLCCGMAVAGELVSAVAAAGIVLFMLVRDWKSGLLCAAGTVPGAILLLGHNWLIFGSPLSIGYASEVRFPEMVKTGFFGISLPRLVNFWRLLLSPSKGLFFWSPILLLAFAGLKETYHRHREVFWLVTGVIVLHVLLITAHRSSLGGAAVSARNYMAMIPFFAIPLAYGFRRFPTLGWILGSASVILMALAALVGPVVNIAIGNPLWEHYIPRFLAGTLKMTLLSQWLGPQLPPFFNALPLIAVIVLGATFLWPRLSSASTGHSKHHQKHR